MNIGKYVQLYSEDLELKNYSKATVKNYCSQVVNFLQRFSSVATKPTEISEKQIKSWLLEAKMVNSRKQRISALKLFYKFTVRQPLKFKNVEYPRSEKKLPIVLSVDEIQAMFNVCTNLKHKLILALLYSCGLRVSELINLKWADINRSRMIINIVKGKGNKDRQVMLAPSLIPLLEKYWSQYKSKEYVLNGQKSIKYSDRSVLQVVKQLADTARLNKKVYTHLIRHCSFTHMVEDSVDINLVQRLAGHNNVKTTNIYIHTSGNLISKINSPLNNINAN